MFQAENPIPLALWVEQEIARIQRFHAWYRAEAAKNLSEDWPLEIPPGEWDEQYRMFSDPEGP